MRDDDLVDDHRVAINVDRKFSRSFAVEEYPASAAQVPFCAVSGAHLIADGSPFPALPINGWIMACIFEVPALAVEKNKDVILKNREKIAKLLSIVLVWIGIASQSEKRTLAKIGQKSFCWSNA